ncbi:MAG: type II and III secretion system protein family protein [Methylomonas sp.]
MTFSIDRHSPFRRAVSIFCLLTLCFFASDALATAKHKDAKDKKPSEEILLSEGQQDVLHLPGAPVRIAVGDPEVADVSLTTTPQEVLITGKKPGTTNLHIWGKSQSKPRQYLIRIEPQTIEGEFESLVDHAGSIPGSEPNPKDMTTVDVGGTQIQANIKVVEISRTALKEAGFFFGKNTGNGTIAVSPPGTVSGVQSSTAASTAGSLLLQSAAGFFPYAQAFNMVFGNASEGWLSTVSLLEEGGYAYTLAEPTLVVMSGQTANFLAGGEFPIPVPQGGTASGAITIKYKEFGIRLALTPTLLEANRIMLKVAPEVSDLDFSAGIQSGSTRVPALRTRRTDTSIELGDGESFAISGLISQTTVANEDKLPWLGDIPYIGAFFRSKRFQKDDKELLMVVTPHIVHPLKRDAPLPQLPGEAYRRTNPDFAKFMFYKQEPNKPQRGTMEGFSR